MRTNGALYLELVFFFELAEFIDFEAKYTVMYAVLPRRTMRKKRAKDEELKRLSAAQIQCSHTAWFGLFCQLLG